MKNLSLENLNLTDVNVLNRHQLKTVLGGVCENGQPAGWLGWSCSGGGEQGGAYVCPEHANAYFQMMDEYCE